MQDYIIKRTILEAEHIIKTCSTVRQCAKEFNISKSTVHTDINNRLIAIDKQLYDDVKLVLGLNYREKHLRGGESTKLKFRRKKTKQHW